MNSRYLRCLSWLAAGCYSVALWAADFVVEDIRLEGLQRISAGTVFSYLPVKVGQHMDDTKSAEAIRALYQTGFFKDVQLQRDGKVLVVVLNERPAIAEINITGNKDMETDALKRALTDVGLKEGRVFNQSLLDKIEQELQRQYFGRGKYGVKIDSKVTPLERNRVAVNIEITEGVAARIKKINIIGNKTFAEGDLLSELTLGTTGWLSTFTKNDQYSKQTLGGDLERLRSYYLDRGYLKFDIKSTQVSITPDKKDMYVTIVIDEGDVYRVNDLKLAGNLVLEPDALFPLIKMKHGEVFSRKAVTSTSEQISKALGNQGYAFANVNSIPEINEATKEVALTFYVDPGKRVYVRRVNLTGNTKTRDEVLRRELRQMEMSWFSTSQVQESRERLQRLGYFEQVAIETPAVPGSADQVDVNVKVKEKPSGNLMAGIGYSQSQGIILNTSVSQENFLGTGKKVEVAFDTSEANTLYRFAYTNPYYTLDGVSRGFTLSYRETDFSKYQGIDYYTDSGQAYLNWGLPTGEHHRLNFGLGYEYTKFTAGDSTMAQAFEKAYGDTFNDYRLVSSWVYDTRDRAMYPNRGMTDKLTLKWSTPVSDLEFYKVTADHTQFFPISDRWVFRAHGNVGWGDGMGDTDAVPFFENFYSGGPRTVRGFKENTLGPREIAGKQDPTGGNLRLGANLELLYKPDIGDFGDTIRFSFFIDAGNTWAVYSNLPSAPNYGFDIAETRYSAGIGASWMSPLGPLTVSFAYPLNDEPWDDVQYFQFSFGQTF